MIAFGRIDPISGGIHHDERKRSNYRSADRSGKSSGGARTRRNGEAGGRLSSDAAPIGNRRWRPGARERYAGGAPCPRGGGRRIHERRSARGQNESDGPFFKKQRGNGRRGRTA